MCGRATLTTSPEDLRSALGLDDVPDLLPRYNIAPSQTIAVVREPRRLELLRWGLSSHHGAHAGINVRVETVARAPAYRDSLRNRRCLVVVDGFYEWRRLGKTKTPFLLRRPDGEPFALAGIWDRAVTGDGEIVEGCAVITTPARGVVRELHDRMPLVLPPDRFAPWLDGGLKDVSPLLEPAPVDFVARAVSTAVNSPANDDPRCVEPVAHAPGLGETGWLF
jgi:putative SOS response-associated peptidase YedK